MNPNSHVAVKAIDHTSTFLEKVRLLWRNHAATLGFFPEGAFQDYAAKKQIIIAVNSAGDFLGYLLFRITPSRGDASIVHLCVDPTVRSQGIAKLLVKELINLTKDLRGIGLRCRRDFSASTLWPSLGFIAASDLPGKSHSRNTLTYWWLDHNHPDLFTDSIKEQFDQKFKVVIDANVFYDLKNQSNEESMALIADWLNDSTAICITDEIFNEINRSQDHSEREACRKFSSQLLQLSCPKEEFDQVFQKLKKYLPLSPSIQDKSDYSHLARAIYAGGEFFVTRDQGVLNRSDELYDEFGVTVIRPSELITQIDTLFREHEYQPARLAGTLCEISRMQVGQESKIVGKFQNQAKGETQSKLKNNLRNLLATPHESECLVAWDYNREPMGLIAYSYSKQDILDVSFLRIVSSHPLAKTIIRFLIGSLINKATLKKCNLIQVTDDFLDEKTKEALSRDHFISTHEGWVKISLPGYSGKEDVLKKLDVLKTRHAHIENHCNNLFIALSDPEVFSNPSRLWQIEAMLLPVKLAETNIPTFIIPIKPQWALHLFDEGLANRDMFGAKIDLALNREGVYYRSKRNSSGITAPARILWYVSQSDKHPESGAIRACSRLDEVLIGTPKTLFKQFRRLGVYEWDDVLGAARNDANTEIMALRFSETEMLNGKHSWLSVREMLAKLGIKTHLQNPCKIPESLLHSILSNS